MGFGNVRSDGNAEVVILLDNGERQDGSSLLLDNPRAVVACEKPDGIDAAFDVINRALHDGLYAAGFFAYELGYFLEPRLAKHCPERRQQPLLWVALFESVRYLSALETTRWLADRSGRDWSISRTRLSIGWDKYLSAFQSIKGHIASGEAYQINFTFKYLFEFSGDPFALYRDLRRNQRVFHGGLIAAPDFQILSLSPEVFLRVCQRHAETRPMKGTAPRGLTLAEDNNARTWLRRDEKSRAENLMIVDLLRNDLGRLAEVGSVCVTDLFAVETLRTVHQMTSGVRAILRPDIGVRDLLRGIFPCGSVTGAPKIRAMEIIRQLESEPRGIYTGSIGLLSPNGDISLNVAIRTLMITPDGRGEMGVGSGIVFDSDAEAEFAECVLKARFLTQPTPPFSLLETLRWDASAGFYLLERHLDRLSASAEYFAFPCDLNAIRSALEEHVNKLGPGCHKIRLLVDEDGLTTITAEPFVPAADGVLSYVFAEVRTNSRDPFYYHKTTFRVLYEAELARLRRHTGCDEVIFCNEHGHVTEGARTNVFIERNGRLATPPITCGLLDGTLRRELLETRPDEIVEDILTLADLASANRVFLGNSVRGLQPARLCKNKRA